jgi:hypothetical protein
VVGGFLSFTSTMFSTLAAKYFFLKKLHFFGLAWLFMVAACRPDVKVAGWEVDTLTPLLKTRIDANNLLSDTTLQADENGLLKLVIRNKISSIKPGEVAPPFNRVYNNTAKITSINLGNRVVREDLTLGQMAGSAGIVGQLILLSHGTTQAIPPVSGIGPTVFPVDATNFFQTVTLRDGYMILRMENGLPIELQNVQYSIGNQGGGPPILQNTISSLLPNTVFIDSVRLQNGITITGQLEAVLQNVDSPGSNGPVAIDTTDAIKLSVTVNKLDPTSATAIFPAQNLIEDTSFAVIDPPSALLTSVYLEEGFIYMDATSTIDDEISLVYAIPPAVQNGRSLEFNEILPAASAGGSSQTRVQASVAQHTIDLTGLPGATGVFNEFYATFKCRVDSSGRLINLALTDSVYIETGIDDLVASRGYGFMGYDSIYSQDTNALDVFASIGEGSINFEQAQLSLELENFIGAPMDLKLMEVKALKGNETKSLTWGTLGNFISLGRASEGTPGQRPVPQRTLINLDENNSNIEELLSLQPKAFAIELEAQMNRGKDSSDLSQFIYTEYGIDAYLNAEIPLNLSLSALAIKDTQDFNYLDIDPKNRLQGGDLRVLAKNFYPFEAELAILLLSENGEVLDTLQAAERLAAAPVDNNGRATEEAESTLIYPLDAKIIEGLKDTRKIILSSTFNTDETVGAVKFYSDNYLDLQLVGNLSFSTQ